MLLSSNEGKLCEFCGIGSYQQAGLKDENTKTLTCTSCGYSVPESSQEADDDKLMILG